MGWLARGAWILLGVLAAVPVGARCLGPGDLARGIAFDRDGGFPGRVVARDGGVFVDYAHGQPSTDARQTLLGIYELSTLTALGADFVGAGAVAVESRFQDNPPEPVAGQTWQSWVRLRIRGDGTTGPESGKFHVVRRQVRYSFLAERDVMLSGCRYRAIPVEAVFRRRDDELRQRWIYFPDLGFGLETIPLGRGVAEGLTALRPG